MPPYIKNTLLNFFSFFLIAFSLYIFISLISYNPSDSGFFNKNSSIEINNLGGPLGASISDFLITLFGYGSFLLLLIGCVWSIQSLFLDSESSTNKTLVRLASSIFLLLCFSSIGEFYFMNKFGGIVGSNILNILSSYLGNIGALIFLVILVIPATSLSFNFSWINVIDQTGIIIVNLSKFILDQLKLILASIKKIIILFFSSLKKIVQTLQDNGFIIIL